MALNDHDIFLFVESVVYDDVTSEPDRIVCTRNALACYEAVLRDIRIGGYRCTQRVKDGVQAELERIVASVAGLPKLAA